MREVCACVCEGDMGGTAGFRRVSSATYTEQLAAGVEKEDWMSTEGIQ